MLLLSKHETFNQCWLNVAQRRRRWANIQPTLLQRLVFGQEIISFKIETTAHDVCALDMVRHHTTSY